MQSKKWYTSKTIWLGVIAVIIAGLEMADKGGDYVAILLAVFGCASVVLRGFTNAGLTK